MLSCASQLATHRTHCVLLATNNCDDDDDDAVWSYNKTVCFALEVYFGGKYSGGELEGPSSMKYSFNTIGRVESWNYDENLLHICDIANSCR